MDELRREDVARLFDVPVELLELEPIGFGFRPMAAPHGDILSRIDSAVDAWEHGDDAFHWRPSL